MLHAAGAQPAATSATFAPLPALDPPPPPSLSQRRPPPSPPPCGHSARPTPSILRPPCGIKSVCHHRAQFFSSASSSPPPKSSCAPSTPPLTVGPYRYRLPPQNLPESREGAAALPAPGDARPHVLVFLLSLSSTRPSSLSPTHQPAGDHRRRQGPPEPPPEPGTPSSKPCNLRLSGVKPLR
jgi:hypothetical protein